MSEIKIIKEKISLNELKEIAKKRFGDMAKAVVDVEARIMAIGGQLHSDEEAMLLDDGSKQDNLWGINIFVDQPRDSWVEFDSMINIRPRQNNRSRLVESPEIQRDIVKIVNSLVQ